MRSYVSHGSARNVRESGSKPNGKAAPCSMVFRSVVTRVAMGVRVGLLSPVRVVVGMNVPRGCGLFWRRLATLLPQLHPRGHRIVVLRPAALHVRHEALRGFLVHVERSGTAGYRMQ